MYTPRYIFRLIQAFFKKFKVILFFSVFIGAVIFLLTTIILPSVLTRTREKIGIVGKYSVDNLPDSVVSLISSGLTTVDETGIPNPSLAKSWETTDGGKTWIFTLDDQKTWQDGENIKSGDINYEFSDAEINKIDDKTIEFKLQTPFSAFPVVVSKPLFKKGLLGTGEWEVKKVSLVGGFVNKITLTDQNNNAKNYTFYPTEERLKLGYKLGEINTISDVSDPKPFDTWRTSKVETQVSANRFTAVFLNTEDQFLAEKTVRQALNYGVDKSIFGENRALGPISQESWGYNPQVKPYELDIEKAKELLDSKEEIPLVLSTTTNLLDVAEKIKSDWEKIGIKTEIQVVSGIPENYQAFLATVDIPKDPDQYVLWHSTQETNLSHYKNPRIDKLLEDGRTELQQEERKKIYLDFQRFLIEDSPAIFLYHPASYTITRK